MGIYAIILLALAVFIFLYVSIRLRPPRPRHMSKATARAVFAACWLGVASGLGLLIYILVIMERFRATVRVSVAAMNDPEKLAQFEHLIFQDRLVTGLVLVAIVAGAAANIWFFRTMMKTGLSDPKDFLK